MLESIIIKIKQVLMSSFPDTSFSALTKLLDSDSTSLPADVLWDSFVTHSSGSPSKSCLKCQKKTVKKKNDFNLRLQNFQLYFYVKNMTAFFNVAIFLSTTTMV